jgi:hypothetical protein
MDDRELLQLAAKAAGIEGEYHAIGIYALLPGRAYWNPLERDDDAFRLAVKLGIDLIFCANYVIAKGSVQAPMVNNANDPLIATRRAIVLAAAAIAKESSNG